MLGIPNSVSEVTMDWLAKTVKINILPSSYKLRPNAHEGAGFLSDMCRIEFQSCENVEFHFILKFPPTIETSRNLILADHYDQTEIYTYKTLLPEFVAVLPELEKYLCPFVYGQIQIENENQPYGSVLILKDLKPMDYYMIGFDKDFNNYFIEGLDVLATLHAASYGFENRSKNTTRIIGQYPWFPKLLTPTPHLPGKDCCQRIPELHKWIPFGFSAVFEILKDNLELLNAYKKLEQNSEKSWQNVLEAGQEFPSVLHGDLWTHNILVTRDTRCNIKVIDWQMLGYGDQAFDIAVYILEALHLPDLTKENVLNAAKEYYQKYLDLLKNKLGLIPERNMVQFVEFFRTYGIAYCMFWLILGTPDMSTVLSYIPKVYRIFKLVDEFGVLEFLAVRD